MKIQVYNKKATQRPNNSANKLIEQVSTEKKELNLLKGGLVFASHR